MTTNPTTLGPPGPSPGQTTAPHPLAAPAGQATGSYFSGGQRAEGDLVAERRLKRRLRAFALYLAALFALFLALNIYYISAGVADITGASRWGHLGTHGFALLLFGGFAAYFSFGAPGGRALLVGQWAIFLAMAGLIAHLHLEKLYDNDGVPIARLIAHQGIFAGFGFSFPWVGTLILYGVLVPNDWRRLAAQSAIFSLFPLALTAYMGACDPTLRRDFSLPFLAVLGVMAPASACLLVYSCYLENRLRQDLSEAKRVGPYRLGEKLGEGGMGVVYRAEHRLLKRPCVIKFIRSEVARDRAYRARFEREGQALTAAAHPNIVEIYDYGQTEAGDCYCVMELLEGLTLDQAVRRQGPMPPGRAIHVLRQVASALAAAHARGLVHRDIKPANVFLCERGGQHDFVKVLDFGLVHDAGHALGGGSLTQTGVVMGTPGYLSPEQAAGVALDGRSDLYSLGCVGFFLVAGRPPFRATTPLQLLAAPLTDNEPSLREARPGAPEDLAEVIDRCLRRRPDERFVDALHLLAALDGCSQSTPWTQEAALGGRAGSPSTQGGD